MKYKEQKNTVTGATRWIPVEEKKTWSQKAIDIPVAGDILGSLIPSGTGIGTAISAPVINKQIGQKYGASRDIIKQAMGEQDPTRKAELLQRSRDIDTRISKKVKGYTKAVESGMGYFNDPNKKTNTLIQKLGAYGPQATRTAIAAGTLLAPGVSGVAKPATSMLGRVASSGLAGMTVGGTHGFVKEDVAGLEQRASDAVGYGTTGLVLGLAFGGGKELVNKIRSSKTIQEMIKQKGWDKLRPTKAWSNLQKEGAKNASKKFSIPQLKKDLINEINKNTSVGGPTKQKMLKWADDLWKTGDTANFIIQKDGTLVKNLLQKQETKSMISALGERQAIGRANIWDRILRAREVRFDKMLYRAFNKQLKTIPDIAKYDTKLAKYFKLTGIGKKIAYSLGFVKVLKALGLDPAVFIPKP